MQKTRDGRLLIGLLLALLFVLAAPAPGHALAADSQRAERNRQIDIVQEQGVPLFLPLIIASEEQVVIENLLPNGDFEDGALAGWEASAGAVAATDHAHGGNYAACLTNNASMRSQWIVVQPGRTYKLTAWVKIVEERITGDDLWGGFSDGRFTGPARFSLSMKSIASIKPNRTPSFPTSNGEPSFWWERPLKIRPSR